MLGSINLTAFIYLDVMVMEYDGQIGITLTHSNALLNEVKAGMGRCVTLNEEGL